MKKLLLSIFLCFSLCNVPAVSLPKFFSLEPMAYAFFWGKPGGPFSPSDLLNLKLWLKADAITGLNDNDPITTWSDSSGQGNDATQTGANRPTYKTNIVNGKPVTRYGSNIYFNLPNFLTGFTAGTIFIVVKIVTDPPLAANTGIIWFGSVAAAMHYPWEDGIIYDTFGTTVRKTTVNPSPSLTSWRVYSVISETNNWTNYLDNSQLFNTVSNTVGWIATPIVGKSDGGYFLDGDIAEVVFYSSALSSGDRTSVYNYLKTKYGL